MKPILIVMPGPSVQELDDRIQEFKDFNVIWATTNSWDALLEYFILNKIRKRFDRDFIFEAKGIKYNVGLFGNFLADLVNRDFTNIFLFGCDGGKIKSSPDLYYKGLSRDYPDAKTDTDKINRDFLAWTSGHKSKIYNVSLESNINVFEKISYEQAIEKINNLK